MRRRKVPLEKCPDLKCRRARACMHPWPDTHCRKVFADVEDRRAEIVRKIAELQAELKRDGVKPEPMNIVFEDDEDRRACTYYIICQEIAQRFARQGRSVGPHYIPERYRLENLYAKKRK
ncbi:MAG: hypothetical protein JNM20_01210 [Rhizobiales bacterium]|nr:hypothetical protein [Hyphomicrobiales bacterium]